MVEVGNPELPRLDAIWWLVESKRSLRTSMMNVLVADMPNSLDIEIWQLRPNNRRQTQSSPKDVPTATQQVHGRRYYHGTILKISLFYPFFNTPNPSSCDIIQFTKMAQHNDSRSR